MAKRKKPRLATAKKPIAIPQEKKSNALEPVEPSALTADDVFPAFVAGANQMLKQLAFWNKIYARLNTYFRIHPERYAHFVAFAENGVDMPTDEDVAKVLAKAKEIFG